MDLAGLRVPSIPTGAYGSDIVRTANHLVPVQRNPIRFRNVIGMQYKSPFDVSRQARETGIDCRPFARIAQIRANLQGNCRSPGRSRSSSRPIAAGVIQNKNRFDVLQPRIVLESVQRLRDRR